MAMFADKRTTVTAVPDNFFNPYAGMGPPSCCYCAPTGVQISQNSTVVNNVTNITNEAQQEQQQQIQIEVNASIQATIPGLSNLAFMTKIEDGMRTLERGRIEARNKRLTVVPGAAEMGHGPFFYPKDEPRYTL